ncbi:hypothetical protein POTOM_016519 [Populus tomentosa]|uniref:F-box associated beta-propeller type 1 domain-containing protein n=1 Tax=Populus tomentosa TaxID=118781 RepID=A0A8X8A506_POPTO|nr:hypothetical protein POTOM_016519 [Populus tomentosa]
MVLCHYRNANLLFASTRKFDGLVANYMEVANVVVDCQGTMLVGVTGMCGGGGFEVKKAITKIDDADEATYWLSSLSWRTLISDPEFANRHFERDHDQEEVVLRPDGPGSLSRTLILIDLDRLKPYAQFALPLNDQLFFSGIEVVNSCNGLLCLSSYLDKNPVLVCNPITREYINIPATHTDHQQERSLQAVASGLGFSLKSNHYKLLRIFDVGYGHGFDNLRSNGRQAEIYTLGKGSWRVIDQFPPRIPHSFLFGTYLKGTISWACANDINDKFDFIISFSFDKEQFEFVSLPPYFAANHKGISDLRMQELGGCISVHHPIRILNNEEILMIQGLNALVSYNHLRMKLRRHKIHGIQSNFGASIHIPSFVSLKDIVGGDVVEVLIVKVKCM